LQIYFYFYSLLRAGVVSSFRARRRLPPVKAGSAEAGSEDIGVAASLVVAAVAGAINMVATSPAQVRGGGAWRSLIAQATNGARLWWLQDTLWRCSLMTVSN
jgi:hypothetical protein